MNDPVQKAVDDYMAMEAKALAWDAAVKDNPDLAEDGYFDILLAQARKALANKGERHGRD